MFGAGFKPWLKDTKAAEAAAAAASQSSHMPQPAISAIYTDLRDPQDYPHIHLAFLGFLGAGKYFCLLAKYLTQWPLMVVAS